MSSRNQYNAVAARSVGPALSLRAPVQSLRPLARAPSDWRADLKAALQRSGVTHDCAGAVLGTSRENFGKLLRPDLERELNMTKLEGLRDNSATRETWKLFLEAHTARCGVLLVDVSPDSHNHGERLHAIQVAASALITTYTHANSDGVVTPPETERLIEALQDLLDAGSRGLVSLKESA